ncbi:hypothetical protein F5Y17DRAFT_457491 [Xylariaceae sp. FL0594]|nr:hypothetical protein F5Y17DRAFT_457491 [Xylariaceae sp. FL0594]
MTRDCVCRGWRTISRPESSGTEVEVKQSVALQARIHYWLRAFEAEDRKARENYLHIRALLLRYLEGLKEGDVFAHATAIDQSELEGYTVDMINQKPEGYSDSEDGGSDIDLASGHAAHDASDRQERVSSTLRSPPHTPVVVRSVEIEEEDEYGWLCWAPKPCRYRDASGYVSDGSPTPRGKPTPRGDRAAVDRFDPIVLPSSPPSDNVSDNAPSAAMQALLEKIGYDFKPVRPPVVATTMPTDEDLEEAEVYFDKMITERKDMVKTHSHQLYEATMTAIEKGKVTESEMDAFSARFDVDKEEKVNLQGSVRRWFESLGVETPAVTRHLDAWNFERHCRNWQVEGIFMLRVIEVVCAEDFADTRSEYWRLKKLYRDARKKELEEEKKKEWKGKGRAIPHTVLEGSHAREMKRKRETLDQTGADDVRHQTLSDAEGEELFPSPPGSPHAPLGAASSEPASSGLASPGPASPRPGFKRRKDAQPSTSALSPSRLSTSPG